MRRILCTTCFLVILCAVSAIEVEGRSNYTNVREIYTHSDYEIESMPNRFEKHDFVFVGEIIEVTSTSYYNGSQTDIPFTHYKVEVIENIKGSTGKSVIDVTYYGGIDENQTLVMYNSDYSGKNYLPDKKEVYVFTVNKTKIEEDTDRNIADSYIVYSPYQMEKLENQDRLNDYYLQGQDYLNEITIQPFTCDIAVYKYLWS